MPSIPCTDDTTTRLGPTCICCTLVKDGLKEDGMAWEWCIAWAFLTMCKLLLDINDNSSPHSRPLAVVRHTMRQSHGEIEKKRLDYACLKIHSATIESGNDTDTASSCITYLHNANSCDHHVPYTCKSQRSFRHLCCFHRFSSVQMHRHSGDAISLRRLAVRPVHFFHHFIWMGL